MKMQRVFVSYVTVIGAKPPYYEMARVFVVVVVVVVGSSSLIIRFRSNAVLNNNNCWGEAPLLRDG